MFSSPKLPGLWERVAPGAGGAVSVRKTAVAGEAGSRNFRAAMPELFRIAVSVFLRHEIEIMDNQYKTN